MTRIWVRLPQDLFDMLDQAAVDERMPLESYAGRVLQVGWETLQGIRSNKDLADIARQARETELQAKLGRQNGGDAA